MDQNRYNNGMKYCRCGRSGVLLPKVSLGFWHNFGEKTPYETSRQIALYAFDHGVTHLILPTTMDLSQAMLSAAWEGCFARIFLVIVMNCL